MKKYLPVFILSTLIIPSVAFASWWNPFTWSIFSSYQSNSQGQTISTTTLPNQIPADNLMTTATTTISVATTTEVIVATTSTPKINVPVKKVTKKVIPPAVTSSPVLQVQTSVVSNSSDNGSAVCPSGYTCTTSNQSITPPPVVSWTDLENKDHAIANQNGWTSQTITNNGETRYYRLEAGTWVRKDTLAESQQPYQPPNTTPCNGTNWNQCPTGQNFVCPGNGGQAYCQLPQTTQTPVTIQTNIPQTQTSQITTTPVSSSQNSASSITAQQTQCQLQYNNQLLAFNAENANTLQTEASVKSRIAADQQKIDWYENNSPYNAGVRAYIQDLSDAQTGLASMITANEAYLQTIKDSLQSCLSLVH